MYGAIKRILFKMDPERAHHLAMRGLRVMHNVSGRHAVPTDARLATTFCGIDMPNPIGIAAGFDKEAQAYNALGALGFGHVEIGTVTPEPQLGNPKPRVHRVPEQSALLNSMGFPGPGWEAIQARIDAHPARIPIGINIGPNKDRSRNESLERLTAMARDAPGDYVALNISSPNTPGLRELQEPKAIAGFIGGLREAMDDGVGDRPLLLKLHPDGDHQELKAVGRAAIDAGAAGLIAVNTTRERPVGIPDMPGGLSGAPLRKKALDAVAVLGKLDVPLIGVGGISTGADAWAMRQAGADLVQVYTSFIYRGPRTARLIQAELLEAMRDADW
jgi:dihydroorotate dehydrogenase